MKGVGPTSSLKYADSAQTTQHKGKEMILGARMQQTWKMFTLP